MRKIVLIIVFVFFVTLTGGCINTDITPSELVIKPESAAESTFDSSSTESTSDLPSPESGTESSSESETASTMITRPFIEDIPEKVSNVHDFSTGNYIYNPNALDTTNKRRYNGEFNWRNDSKVLWTRAIDETRWSTYDAEGAVSYGKANWNTGEGLCAEFISRCLTKGGGITEFTQSSTSITLMLLNSRLGFGQFLPYSKEDNTITLPSYARPGDVVQLYCTYEGVMMHSTLFVGTDDKGRMRAVAHNFRNSGEKTFYVDYLNDPCFCCNAQTAEVFFYHFYRDDDKGLPEEIENNRDIVLWEERGYTLPDEKYDRGAALKYARSNPKDGFGAYGANHTYRILKAGGCSVGYPIHSAIFLQLLKTHLGSAESLKVRGDRTVILPDYAEAGDMCFVYCPSDGIMISSFLTSGADEYGRMIAESYDLVNDGKSAFKVDSCCPGCGEEISEVILYHFDD